MEKKTRILALVVVLVFATATANATLTMTLLDLNGGSVELGDTVSITISSDVKESRAWGVYLDPTSDYSAGSIELTSAAVTANAGSQGAVTAGTPASDAGHDYLSKGGGIVIGDWSTVDFASDTLGTYTIDLTTGGSGGTELATADIVVVPEPATVALLGLGGLLVLIRRR